MHEPCRVLVPKKVDLDVCGAAYLLGVTREEEVEVLRGDASPSDLFDPDVWCIEVGGAGRIDLNNWDHHGPEAEGLRSATLQVFYRCWVSASTLPRRQLVNYIDRLDVEGPRALGQSPGFPTLSDVFSGMLLVTRDSVEQLHRGVEILCKVVQEEIDPFGRMPVEKIPQWATFAEAKAENDRQMAEAVKSAQWTETSSGLKLGFLETRFWGAPGALYGQGAQVVVVLNPNFHGTRKATIAGNDIRVDAVLPRLSELEPGWGGPATGTILGSPREEGTKLFLEEIVDIVKKTL